MKLPCDVTRCHGAHCTIRQQCLRHTAPIPDNILLSWASSLNPEEVQPCPYFLPSTSESDFNG